MDAQEKLTPIAALRVIAGEHYTSAQYARDLARATLAGLPPAVALELGTVGTAPQRGLELTDEELELLVGALAMDAIVRGRAIEAKARNAGAPSAGGALRELVATTELGRRLSRELQTRRVTESDDATRAAAATCEECGGLGGTHESDCDLRPL